MSFPIPGAGLLTGESDRLGLDLGASTKQISLTGVITDQKIYKQFGSNTLKNAASNFYMTKSTGFVEVRMTAHEVAQLIHSFVDSSLLQKHQSIDELLVLIPSFVGKDYNYHSALGTISDEVAVKALDENTTPTIPFNFGVRYDGNNDSELDGKGTLINTSKIADVYTGTGDPNGIKGFVRSFNTTFTGGNPFVDFTLEFEVAITSL